MNCEMEREGAFRYTRGRACSPNYSTCGKSWGAGNRSKSAGRLGASERRNARARSATPGAGVLPGLQLSQEIMGRRQSFSIRRTVGSVRMAEREGAFRYARGRACSPDFSHASCRSPKPGSVAGGRIEGSGGLRCGLNRSWPGTKKKPRIAPGLVKGSTNYFLRRKSSNEAAPKPANASVPGSGIGVPTVKPGNTVVLTGVGEAVTGIVNKADLPALAPPPRAVS